MPNCFQLTRKSDLKAGPVKLNDIDRELCDHFKQPFSTEKYMWYWYDIIGFKLAMGKTFAQAKEDLIQQQAALEKDDTIMRECYDNLLELVSYLDEHYTSDAWYQVGK